MTRLYISGPIKGVEDAEAVFAAAAADLAQRGYEALNPYDVTPICDCPEGAELTNETRHYDCYMRGDIAGMVACDGVAMLPGWERSRGARLENFVALSVGMNVQPIASWMTAGQPVFA